MKIKWSPMKLLWLAALGSVAFTPPVGARCMDELNGEPIARNASRAGAKGAPSITPLPASEPVAMPEFPLDPQTQLQVLAREASRRSAEVGSAQLLAEAASYDLAETRADRLPQVTVSGQIGPGGSAVGGRTVSKGNQSTLTLSMTAPLYDGGWQRQLTRWREHLAGAAKFGAAVTQEQVVLEAITMALERNRYRLQAQVYQQFMRKMSCLRDALEGIVAEDKGRTSELVQVRKTQAQTELQRDAALAQSRQIEFRLRKLIGDQVTPGDGITVPLAVIPEIGEINRQIEFGNEAQQLRAQAEGLDNYAKAVVAGQRPQVNWAVSKAEGVQGRTHTASWHAGVTVSYSLFNGFSDKAASQAAVKRAESARLQLAGLLATKFAKTSEVYDIATESIDRAKRYVEILRDSERVRNFTFQQWSQMGRRSLFDVMSAESEHFNLRIAYVNALHDSFVASAQLRSMGAGLSVWLMPDQKL